MDDLIAFLISRLDEDEEVARETHRNEQFVYGTDRWFASHGNAITSMAPHRAVAEVEFKRLLLDEHSITNDSVCGTCVTGRWGYPTHGGADPQPYPCRTLRLLALPYAGHRDYLPEWKL